MCSSSDGGWARVEGLWSGGASQSGRGVRRCSLWELEPAAGGQLFVDEILVIGI